MNKQISTRTIIVRVLLGLLIAFVGCQVIWALLFLKLFISGAHEPDVGTKNAGCSSNMKKLGLAFLQYTEDYDEKWPTGVKIIATPSAHGLGWGTQIYSYVRSTSVYKC